MRLSNISVWFPTAGQARMLFSSRRMQSSKAQAKIHGKATTVCIVPTSQKRSHHDSFSIVYLAHHHRHSDIGAYVYITFRLSMKHATGVFSFFFCQLVPTRYISEAMEAEPVASTSKIPTAATDVPLAEIVKPLAVTSLAASNARQPVVFNPDAKYAMFRLYMSTGRVMLMLVVLVKDLFCCFWLGH